MRRHILLITAAWALFILLPSFFERLHSDEVIYWEIAKNIAKGLGPISETSGNRAFVWHMPLPFFIVAPFLKLSQHIFAARAVSALFTLATALLVYMTAREKYDREKALVSAVLFLFSFQALRFGGRYYLDQYGAFFFILSLFFLAKGRPIYAGLAALLSVAAREHWLAVYPFFFLYLSDKKKSAALFAAPGVAAVICAAVFLSLKGTPLPGILYDYVLRGAALKNLSASFTDYSTYGLAASLARAWGESVILNLLMVTGAFFALKDERRFLWLIFPQAVVISMIHGFLADGGVTQYTFGLLASLSIFAGAGLKRLHELVLSRPGFVGLSIGILFFQYIGLNALATAVSLHGNIGVYGLGYWDDGRVISILREKGEGKYIHGIHGAFVEKRLSWDWTDYFVQEAIEKDPDLLVTFSNYVEVLPGSGPGGVSVHNVGPYLIIENPHNVPLRAAVRQRDFPKWLLNRGP